MTVPLTLRNVKGFPLSAGEIDANFVALSVARNFTAVSGGQALTVTDNKTTLTNEGAHDQVEFLLPAATPGVEFTFIVQDADGIRVVARSGDTINLDGTVDQRFESTTLGAVVTLRAINATQWIATSIIDTWTADPIGTEAYFNLADYGGVGDGVTDETDAFYDLRIAAQGAAGPVTIFIPAGEYLIAEAVPYRVKEGIFNGIGDCTVFAYGATITSDFSRFTGPHGFIEEQYTGNLYSAYVDTVLEGATTATLKIPALAANFTIGDWCSLNCFEMMGGGGYPPNHHFNQFVEITNIVGAVITFAPAAVDDYLDTYPNGDPGTGYHPGGPACLHLMKRAPTSVWPQYAPYAVNGWDQDLEIRGLTYVNTGGAPNHQHYNNGRNIRFIDMTWVDSAPIPTANKSIYFERCNITGYGIEVDKEIETLEYKDCTVGTISVQSSSVGTITIDGGTVSIATGTPRNMVIRGDCEIGFLQIGTIFGVTETLVIEAPAVISAVSAGYGTKLMTATDFSNSGGELTFTAGYSASYRQYPWQFHVPGSMLYFGDTNYFGGPGALITSFTGSLPGTITDTGLPDPYPSLPLDPPNSGFFALVGIQQNPCISVAVQEGVTGCDAIEVLARAPPGAPYNTYGYKRGTFQLSGGSYPSVSGMGRLVALRVNVIQPYTGPGAATFAIIWPYSGAGHTLAADGSVNTYSPVLNAKIAGERIITPASITGAQSGDALGSAPGNMVFMAYIIPALYADLTGMADEDLPDIEVELLTDQTW